MRGQFLVEIAPADTATAGTTVASVEELNTLFAAWVETVYHRRVHDETGQAPLACWETYFTDREGGGPPIPEPALLREAFLWAEYRTVSKTATVSLHGNTYAVGAALVGRRVELLYDPFDLARIEVRFNNAAMGVAVPHRIGRHAHPAAKVAPDLPAAETGIDYLRLVQAARDAERAHDIVNFTALTNPADPAAPSRRTPDEHPTPGTGHRGRDR